MCIQPYTLTYLDEPVQFYHLCVFCLLNPICNFSIKHPSNHYHHHHHHNYLNVKLQQNTQYCRQVKCWYIRQRADKSLQLIHQFVGDVVATSTLREVGTSIATTSLTPAVVRTSVTFTQTIVIHRHAAAIYCETISNNNFIINNWYGFTSTYKKLWTVINFAAINCAIISHRYL